MTKAEILKALRERRAEGRRSWQTGSDWDAGFRAAEAFLEVFLAASREAVPEPVRVVLSADKANAMATYVPNLTAAEVCGPFNPAKALDAKRPDRAPCPLWRTA